MKDRNDLHLLLLKYCPNVYYQSPESKKMEIPCIIYARNQITTQKADNKSYLKHCSYSMRYVTLNPDDPVIFELVDLEFCQPGKMYVKDNIYHYPYTIYY